MHSLFSSWPFLKLLFFHLSVKNQEIILANWMSSRCTCSSSFINYNCCNFFLQMVLGVVYAVSPIDIIPEGIKSFPLDTYSKYQHCIVIIGSLMGLFFLLAWMFMCSITRIIWTDGWYLYTAHLLPLYCYYISIGTL